MYYRARFEGDAITGLAFSPTDNLLAYTSDSGSFTTWPGVIAPEHGHPVRLSNLNGGGGGNDVDMLDGEDLLDDDDEDGGSDDFVIDDMDGDGVGYKEKKSRYKSPDRDCDGAKEVGESVGWRCERIGFRLCV